LRGETFAPQYQLLRLARARLASGSERAPGISISAAFASGTDTKHHYLRRLKSPRLTLSELSDSPFATKAIGW
jgi:predicted secreted hydrolase